MMKFFVGALCGAAIVYYAGHRSPETEAKVKTEVTKRAPMITKLGND